MSTPQKPNTPFNPVNPSNQPTKSEELVFHSNNYTMMIASIAIIFIGYIIMTLDKEQYGFGFLGITLGPIVSLAGFVLAAFSILVRKKKEN